MASTVSHSETWPKTKVANHRIKIYRTPKPTAFCPSVAVCGAWPSSTSSWSMAGLARLANVRPSTKRRFPSSHTHEISELSGHF